MQAHKIKNTILIGIILGFVALIFSYIALFSSMVVYTDLAKTNDIIKKGGIVRSYGTFMGTYKSLVAYYTQYSSVLKQKRPDIHKRLFRAIFFPPSIALLIFAVFLFVIRAPLLDFRPFQPPESLHGDAKWATEKDIRKAGLRASKGVLLGNTGRGYLVADGFQHILLFAPTGSGKGVGFVIPNLLFWEQSLVCHDIKLENYELTSGYRRKMGQKVFLWNAASPNGITHCYNPLDWVSRELGQQVDDVQKIANLLLPEQEFWNNEARSLFVGVALYLLAVPEKITSFGEVVRTLRSDDVTYNLAVVLDTLGKQIHPVSYMNIAAFLQKADKERSGVISTLNSGLELWANPLIDAATASSDFDFNRIKKEPLTIYVGLTPDNIDRLKPLMQIFYQQAAQILTKHMPKPDEKIGVMFIMDEFPTLGEMNIFKQGIAYFRGYRVRLFLIIQDTEQLKDIYEEAGMNSFLANATYRVTFAANTYSTAEMISQIIGNKTVKQISRNAPTFLDLNPASRSKHISETQRALLLPQEVINLPKEQQIILVESSPPIKTKKIFYYKDPFFTKKLLPKIEIPQQEPYDPKNVGKRREKIADPGNENVKDTRSDNDKKTSGGGNK
jgi:type IV secretion system protein VirD4